MNISSIQILQVSSHFLSFNNDPSSVVSVCMYGPCVVRGGRRKCGGRGRRELGRGAAWEGGLETKTLVLWRGQKLWPGVTADQEAAGGREGGRSPSLVVGLV